MGDKIKKKCNNFLNDNDGMSITDYICVIITAIYLILMITSVIFVLMYDDMTSFELRFSKLESLLGILDDPIKLLLTAYFVNDVAHTIKGGNDNGSTT